MLNKCSEIGSCQMSCIFSNVLQNVLYFFELCWDRCENENIRLVRVTCKTLEKDDDLKTRKDGDEAEDEIGNAGFHCNFLKAERI